MEATRPGEWREAAEVALPLPLPRGSSLSEALLFIDAALAAAEEEEEASSSSFLPPGRKCVGKLLASEIRVSAKREERVGERSKESKNKLW